MKKLIAIVLVAILVMSFAACGAINNNEVAILWSGAGVVQVPNSLINSMERAMYIENILYKHYGANGNQTVQTQQAIAALDAGCAALVIELISAEAAQEIVDAAKAKNVPVVFFNCEATYTGYDKCFLVSTDLTSLPEVQSTQILATLVEEKKDKLQKTADRNGDGKLTYAMFGDLAATVEAVNVGLGVKNLAPMEAYTAASVDELVAAYTEESAPVDLIIADNDLTAQELLTALQAKGYNKDRLKTHFTPIFTVGDTADYKALVLASRPAGEHTDDTVQEYFKSMQYLVDLRTVEEADLETLICTTSNIIGDGRISGTVIVDYDNIAVSVAATLRAMLKSGLTFDGASGTSIDYTVISAG